MARRLISIDLFCGSGGMSLGFEQAGFDVNVAIDSSRIGTAVHSQNFPNTTTICEAVERLSGPEIRRRAALGRDEIAVVFGGPPCQGFSIGGYGDADDPRNEGILHFARLVLGLRPRYFVMENVGGLLMPRYRALLTTFKRKLAHGGYRIVEPIVRLNAADFGVPQRRKRAFVLGYRQGERAPSYPTSYAPRVTVGDAIDDLVLVEGAELVDGDRYRGPLGDAGPYARTLRNKLVGRGSGKSTLVTGFARTTHSEATVQRFSAVVPGGVDPVSRFIRLARDGIAPTLRAGTGFDKGRFMAPRPIHPEFPRCICVREAARLHSFPDWFVFHPTKWHGFMGIGNSVPPRLAQAVAAQLISVLGNSS